MATKALVERKVQTAADLLGLLGQLNADGIDLSRVVLTNGDGDAVGFMSLYAADNQEKTIQPTAEHALCFWLDDCDGQ